MRTLSPLSHLLVIVGKVIFLPVIRIFFWSSLHHLQLVSGFQSLSKFPVLRNLVLFFALCWFSNNSLDSCLSSKYSIMEFAWGRKEVWARRIHFLWMEPVLFGVILPSEVTSPCWLESARPKKNKPNLEIQPLVAVKRDNIQQEEKKRGPSSSVLAFSSYAG